MKLPKLIAKLIGSKAAQEVVAVVVADTTKVVALLMTMPIAHVVRDDIRTIANGSYSGQQKFDIVLGNTLPVLIDLLTGKGFNVAPGDIEDIARAFVQAIYNDTMSTRAGSIARQILALFGIR